MRRKRTCTALAALVLLAVPDRAQTRGVPVAELSSVDTIVQNYMNANGIIDGTVGIMRDGVIVYHRGFGLWENTPMRLASVEKPITAAAIHQLERWGLLELDDFVFDLGQNEGGILAITPWNNTLGSTALDGITIQHLLDHEGGWDRAVGGDPMFMAVQIANDMGVPSPPTRVQTVSYWLTQPLQNTPGTTYAYSNFGYMLLGLVVEQVSGMNHQDFIRGFILTPNQWVPSTEVFRGRSLYAFTNIREPVYFGNSGCQNVFDPLGEEVACPYGGWNLEGMVGHGNLVASVAPLMRFLDRYVAAGSNIGQLHNGSPPNAAHTGCLDGSSTIVKQRSDGISVVVLYNHILDCDDDHASNTADQILAELDANVKTWPTLDVDGFWVDWSSSGSSIGSYDAPFNTVDQLLLFTEDGTKVRLKPGNSGNWSGTIDQKVLIDAPFGTSRIGI